MGGQTETRAEMAQYGQLSYWEDRYTNDKEVFDWYQRYEGIKDIIAAYVSYEAKVLMVGCGNSRLSEEMYEDNIKDITNIDISDVVIKDMTRKCTAMDCMRWHCLDVLALPFGENDFEAVVDKGTLDSVLCGEGSTKNVALMCKHISRVLKPGGVYIVISYGQPDYRLSFFDKPEYNWSLLPVRSIPKPSVSAADPQENDPANVHYVYIMQKNK